MAFPKFTPALLPLYLARLSVIDDQIKENELHLLRLIPLAWVQTAKETKFENMPTEFGPATVRVKLSKDKKKLQVIFKEKFWEQPKRIILHVPPLKGLRQITLNNKNVDWDSKSENVIIK
jgi:hypothetical protein